MRFLRFIQMSSALLWLCLLVPSMAFAAFDSGSTGADSAFEPTASKTVDLPENGVFNFTTVNIPTGVTISFKKNAKNTPVTILATGDVTINGTINVSGASGNSIIPGIGGPGGFNGGQGAAANQTGKRGEGPGGGWGGNLLASGATGGGWGAEAVLPEMERMVLQYILREAQVVARTAMNAFCL